MKLHVTNINDGKATTKVFDAISYENQPKYHHFEFPTYTVGYPKALTESFANLGDEAYITINWDK